MSDSDFWGWVFILVVGVLAFILIFAIFFPKDTHSEIRIDLNIYACQQVGEHTLSCVAKEVK